MQRRAAVLLLASLVGMSGAQAADPSTYPSAPIRLVSSYSAGGGNDLIARSVAAKLQTYFKQTVLVENREGGGGNIGVDYVAKAPADGYTLLVTAQSLTMRPALFKGSLPFDVRKDFAPLGIVGSFPIMFLARPNAGFDSIPSMLAYAKANPDKLSYGTPGVGTTQHVAMELFKAETGASLLHIPYRGASKAVTDAISGEISVLVSTPSTVMPFVQQKQLRILGTGEVARLPSLANAPTIGETVKGFQVNNWLGLMAPAATPQAIVDKLDKALVAICNDPDFVRQLAAQGFVVKSQNAPAARQQVEADLRKWGEVITAKQLRAE